MKRRSLLGLAFVACLASAGAAAQGMAPGAAAPGCPASAAEMPVEALFGNWEARFDRLPGVARVQLARHPDYAGVRGTITRGGGADGAAPVAQLAGDVGDDGMLNLDESLDGQAISGVWLGELAPGSCGKEFKGIWRNANDDSTHPFVLTHTGNLATDR